LPLTIASDVPLAPFTTFELGGPARFFVEAADEDTVAEALAWADQRDLPTFIFGGGSNLLVADEGFDGLVIRMALRGLHFDGDGRVTAAAGEPWDLLVDETVARGWAGLECLSGIPGLTGATPIQNVGAYGQDVAETIRSVRVLDRGSLGVVEIDGAGCEFGYRDSAFKRAPGRQVVLAVTFALQPGGTPALRYPELVRALSPTPAPSLADTRAAVLSLRRRKSMVIDPADPNRRSAGSFFTNPLVAPADAARVAAQAVAEGLVASPEDVPRFPAADGMVKLAAGWLIERAGLQRGMRRGTVGISSAHALALVHHGGGTTTELLDLARDVRDRVEGHFGVRLQPEPTLLGVAF
jgi:UDP-N-acetylmuramate dehydrogenase